MASFKIEIPSTFQSQLRSGVAKNTTDQIFARIGFTASNILKQVSDLLVNIFESTEVAQSLRGNGSEDLAAHFGLSSSEANSLVEGMSSIIYNSVNLITQKTGDTGIIQIKAIDTNYSEFLSLPGAEYASQPSNIIIPVMRWLLIDPDIDIGAGAYDIVFLGKNAKLDARIERVSRSGRAIMVELEKLGGGSGYVLPAIVRGNAGANFIEYVLRQSGVAQQVAEIIIKNIT